MNIAIEPARAEHVEAILANLREHDKPLFASIPEPAEMLCEAIRKSSQSYVGLLNGEAVVLWGVEARTILSDTAFMWMVTTPVVEAHPIPFVRRAAVFIRSVLAEHGQVEGTVVTSNTIAVKWVTWLGAELEEVAPGVLVFRLRQVRGGRNGH